MKNAGISSKEASATDRGGSLWGLMVVGMLTCGAAGAQDASWSVHPALTDRWSLQLGAYFPKADTTASLNSTAGTRGTSISFEDDLGLDDSKTTATILGSVRLGERWKIEAEYLFLDRSGSRSLSRTLNWGDHTYNLGATVNSEFNSNIYRLSAGYSFVKNNQSELGVVLGLHVTDFEAKLSAPNIGSDKGDVLAPLPTVGIYGAYAFTPRWLLSGRMDYFSLNYNDYDGRLFNASAGVDYRFMRNFGVGVGYRYVDYDLTASKARYTGNVSYKFNGPVLYVVGSF